MSKFFAGLGSFLKKEIVLVAAWILAIVSMFFVKPNVGYFSYIDWSSLGILWSLMVIMNAFRQNNVFDTIAGALLKSTKKIWQLEMILVLLCFFFSMLITNDVALLTFVPFTILLLASEPKLLIPTIVLQTVAANLGSMLTPIGNPQNLYLFSQGSFTLWTFIKIMLPYSTLSLILIVAGIFIIPKITKCSDAKLSTNSSTQNADAGKETSNIIPKHKLIVFLLLFVLAILTVIHLVPYYVLVAAVLIMALIFQRKAIVKADYALFFTFIGFFIFTGNMAKVPAVNNFLSQIVGGKEILCGVAVSQIISNVPAALLLSGFTQNLKGLTVGVNLGGLGTLIASMASLISFKFYARTENSKSGKYLLIFTAVNLLFLALLVAEVFVISKIS